MSIFTLARRMGTSVQMIDVTYGHLAHDSESRTMACWTPTTTKTALPGTLWARIRTIWTPARGLKHEKTPPYAGLLWERAREDSNLWPSVP
jgi:hypothetical protein